jgi:hypothetical protein
MMPQQQNEQCYQQVGMMPQLLNDEQYNLNRHDASTTKQVARIATMKKVGVDTARTMSRR